MYFVGQSENDNYDTFDSFVVAAPDEKTAMHTHPSGKWEPIWSERSWVKESEVEELVYVRLIGVASAEYERVTIICSSYNAG